MPKRKKVKIQSSLVIPMDRRQFFNELGVYLTLPYNILVIRQLAGDITAPASTDITIAP